MGVFAEKHYNFDLKSFYNLNLGLPYEDPMSKQIEFTHLENKRDFTFNLGSIPDDVLYLVSGTDQQLYHTETTIIGITDNEKKIYVLDHRSHFGIDCTKVESPVYQELANFLNQPFKTVSGRKIPLLGSFIDSSNGNATDTIYRISYKFASRQGKRLFTPIKGAPSGSNGHPLFKKTKTEGKEHWNLNVNLGKDNIYRLIQQCLVDPDDTDKTQIYFTATLPDDYFMQLTSEVRVLKGGNYFWEKKLSGERNEALDCLNYAIICNKWVQANLAVNGRNPFHELRLYTENRSKRANISTEIPQQPQPKPQANLIKPQQNLLGSRPRGIRFT